MIPVLSIQKRRTLLYLSIAPFAAGVFFLLILGLNGEHFAILDRAVATFFRNRTTEDEPSFPGNVGFIYLLNEHLYSTTLVPLLAFIYTMIVNFKLISK